MTGFLEKLKPGTALLTEIEKSETIAKPNGVQKSIWDYSIDFIGPATRTKQQIAVCAKHGIPVYLKSEPELGFEAPRLPQIPCMDRWADRAEVLASCGADGAWVFPAFRPFYGTSTAEINKFLWWTPVPDREKLLHDFAKRLAGAPAADRLRNAWKATSAAIAYSPELPSLLHRPVLLGPAAPDVCECKRSAAGSVLRTVPVSRRNQGCGRAEEGANVLSRLRARHQRLARCYRRNGRSIWPRRPPTFARPQPLVDERHRLTFDAEAGPILWFYHTARTHANFYESCQLRDALAAALKKGSLSPEEKADAIEKLARWKAILEDELDNTNEALPLMQARHAARSLLRRRPHISARRGDDRSETRDPAARNLRISSLSHGEDLAMTTRRRLNPTKCTASFAL